ncbi:MAG: HAMP domain-containing histidine kinase [Candidatus Melainabacteria bacterium]|nr:HAMP domain-containing histidine kinase [Candidatus Melainabacteria bacterium]
MFKSVRLRLTLWFVVFSFVAYIVTSITTGLLLHYQLTLALDNELDELIAENLKDVGYREGRIFFVTTTSSIQPAKMHATIQLFDTNNSLLYQLGPSGVATRFDDVKELSVSHYHHLRIKPKRLFQDGTLIGYLQVQIPTDQRDHAERERFGMVILTMPLLLALLSTGGYYFTGLAIKPADQAVAILRDFMINAGHELNTPLSIAQTVLDNIDRKHAEPSYVLKKTPVLKLSLTRMRNIIDDLMILARLDSDAIVSQPLQIVPLHEIVSATIKQIEPVFEERKLSFSVEQLSECWVRGNPLQLEQILTNLLQNAAVYNKPKGSISLSLSKNQHQVVLTIRDTGFGISRTDLSRIFDRFFRAENSLSERTAGSGLGLSIVKAIVGHHRGEIKIYSELNAGTIVTVQLPAVLKP